MGNKILGIDFETTGISAADDRITEAGAVLWDWDTKTPITMLTTFVHPERPIPEEITKLTGITDEMVENYGRPEGEVFADLDYLMGCADYAMAHKAEFDKGFYDAAAVRTNQKTVERPWLCTIQDIKYPPEITTRKLGHLAADHGFANPFSHRALFDVLTMLKIASNYDLDAIIARSKEPTLYVQAFVSFNDKDKAKELGFRWYAPSKIWWKDMKASDYEAMKDTCEFNTGLLAGPLE